MTAWLQLTLSVTDDHGRQATPVPPLGQGWTATVREVRTVTVPADDTLTVDVPDGSKLLYCPLDDNLALTFNGASLCDADTALGLPLCYPLGGQSTVEFGNTNEDDDVTVEICFL